MSSSWEDDDETATAVAGCLRQFRDLVRLDSAHVTPDLEREMARRARDLMADMLSQQHPTTPTPRGHQFGMPTPGTSASPWSTSAEVRERLQAAQREERRTVQVNKFKRIQEEQQERLRRAEEEEQERLRRAAEEEQERANRWRAAQEERRKQADRLEAQNAAAAKARADAAAAAALRAQNQAADRVMLNNFSVQQELNNQNFKQQSHISLRLRHTRASQAMRAFFARAEAQAKAELDQLRAQQDELALASAQQDLDRLILQHDPANQVDAARRAALQEQARQAEEDRLRLEREQAAQAEADRLAAAREAELQRAAAARQADAERLAAEQRAETERQRVRAARQARMDDETALSGSSQLTIIIDQWQADFLQVVHPLGYHTELYRAVAHLWLVDEHSLDIVRKKCQALWDAVLSGDEGDINPAKRLRQTMYAGIRQQDDVIEERLRGSATGTLDVAQIIADAFDIQLVVYKRTNRGWTIHVRGSNGQHQRRIHLVNYSEIQLWAALEPRSPIPPFRSVASVASGGAGVPRGLPRVEGSDDVVGVTVDNTNPPEDLPVNAENKLRVLYSASEILEAIQASDIPSFTRAGFEPPLPRKRVGKQGQTVRSALDMLDWMSNIIKNHYRKELDEAKAKRDGDIAVLQPTEAQGLSSYANKPALLLEDASSIDVTALLGHIKQIRQNERATKLQRLGLDSWVLDIIRAIQRRNKAENKLGEIMTTELVFAALGIKFPQGYPQLVTASLLNNNNVEFLFVSGEAGEKMKANAAQQWRNRLISYFRNMKRLREEDCMFVATADMKNLQKVLSDITKPDVDLLPWAKLFRPIAQLVSHRAWSIVHGDWSGRKVLELEGLPTAPLLESLTELGFEVKDWHDLRSRWDELVDAVTYNESHPSYPMGTLASPLVALQEGFLGDEGNNFSWSLWPRLMEDNIEICASVPIPKGAFLGYLPGVCCYSPSEPVPDDCIRSNVPGLYINDDRPGLLTHVLRGRNFESCNVIVGWEPFSDEKCPSLTSFHLVLFSYREIPAFQPLKLWNHMEV